MLFRHPFEITWKGRPLSFYKTIPSRSGGTKYEQGGRLRANQKYTVCCIAYEFRMSEKEFYRHFSKPEREQILATKKTQSDISWVMDTFPIKRKR